MIKFIRVYKRQLKITLFILITVLSSIFIGITLNSIVENIYLSIEIENFKNKGVYQEDISDSHTKYYKVSRETWMSDESVFQEVDGRVTYGNSGDIICTLDSYAGNLQITHDLVGFFFGGHCASVCYQETYNNISYNKNYCIEAHYNNGVLQLNGETHDALVLCLLVFVEIVYQKYFVWNLNGIFYVWNM